MLLHTAALLQIVRPHNMIAAGLAVLAGYRAAGGDVAAIVTPVALVAALATGAGNVINDYYDFAIDRVNKPRRPLPAGRLSPRAALVWYGVLVGLTSALAWLWLPPQVFGLAVLWQVSLFAYARALKRRWVAGNATVAVISASAFLAGSMSAGTAGAGLIPMAIGFAFVVCRELVKGGEDLEGDAAAGVRTLAAAVGRERAARVAAGAMLVVAALLPVPSVAGVYDARYFAVMELLVAPVLVAGALGVVRRPEKRVFGRVSLGMKLAMFAGIVAIALGA